MKKLVLFAALAALSACSKQSETPAGADMAKVEATPSAPEGASPGTYDVTNADGTVGKTVINPDGTYVDTDAKGAATKGRFVHKSGKDCFDPDGPDPEVCWTLGTPGADGSFDAVTPDGKMTVHVTPVAGPATAAPPSPVPAATATPAT
ncbi:MAG: hypothetical protein ACTHK5_10015 [Tsuneonella sp.]